MVTDNRHTDVESTAQRGMHSLSSYLRGVSSNTLGGAHIGVGRAVHFSHVDLGILHAVVLVSQVVPSWLQSLAVPTPTVRSEEEHIEAQVPGCPDDYLSLLHQAVNSPPLLFSKCSRWIAQNDNIPHINQKFAGYCPSIIFLPLCPDTTSLTSSWPTGTAAVFQFPENYKLAELLELKVYIRTAYQECP